LIAAILTLISGVYGEPLTEIPTANMHSIGFVFVVLGRTDLFTGHATCQQRESPAVPRRA
jgi:formate/nitrite transporter FocA (FNT family)